MRISIVFEVNYLDSHQSLQSIRNLFPNYEADYPMLPVDIFHCYIQA